ncbi:hypothetical protein [Bradyrhizobium sp. SZCCHNS1054]|uniref:hypothetical protein n=1 Tax=Bradyrhizobium sp. SZCCHNS1054 TaxID=3057301 RepID=UPI002915CECC|nr:hypothetical protein [Bradyrhizobium sp. SZCCHNS1054]
MVADVSGSATLQPSIPQGGSTTLRVRNNRAWYVNPPSLTLNGGAYVSMIDLSAWVPMAGTQGAQTAVLELDSEMVSTTGPT